METTRKRRHVSSALFTLTKSSPSLGAHTIPTQAQRTQASAYQVDISYFWSHKTVFRTNTPAGFHFTHVWLLNLRPQVSSCNMNTKICTFHVLSVCLKKTKNKSEITEILLMIVKYCFPLISRCVEIDHTADRETQAVPFSQF